MLPFVSSKYSVTKKVQLFKFDEAFFSPLLFEPDFSPILQNIAVVSSQQKVFYP